MLLEPQRTNLVEHSEYILGFPQNTADITLSSNLSPEGYANCWRVEGIASGPQVGIATFAAVVGQTYTGSVYVRKVSGSDTATLRDVDNVSHTINITTEWQRFSVTKTAASTTGRVYVLVPNIGDVIEVYGFQLEEGSYATSYIPTYGSSVTKLADSALKTGVSDLIGQTEGTLFAEVEISNNALGWILDASDGTTTNRTLFFKLTNNQIRFVRNSVTQSSSTSFDSPILSLGVHKIALAYQSGNTAFFIDGVQISTTNTATFTNGTLNKISLGTAGDGSGNQLGDRISQALLFKTRLSNAELIALTTI